MQRPNVLALILAGGAGSRMKALTQVRAKPALPYGGVYRLIDIPLSNCVHSRIRDVWVVEQFQPHSLNDHLLNGRPWDLDRTYGGLRIMPPHQGTSESGWHQGNADAIYRNKRYIRDFDPDLLLVLSADHIYKLDYRAVIDSHLEHNATVTLVTTHVPPGESASRFGNVRVDNNGKVADFAYKPEEPISDIVTTEVFVYDARKLLDMLDELAKQGDDDEAALKDFGDELLPKLVEEGGAYAFPLNGYWRDVGTIEAYWRSHMDLLQPEPPVQLDAPDWPILTRGAQRLPARIHAGAEIENSLIAPGCDVRGRVIDSILGPGVVVAEGAVVRNAVVFHNVTIGADAEVAYAILDSAVRVDESARVGVGGDESQIALIGERARIGVKASVVAGECVDPDAEITA